VQSKGEYMSEKIELRLQALGLVLPVAAAPVANYIPTRIVGELLFVSGQISREIDGKLVAGKLGAGVKLEQGKKAARLCGLALLAQAKAALGDLDRIVACVGELGTVTNNTNP
jgi:enamine deaminase RidA (YjgF/YER057c/UK114 family)